MAYQVFARKYRPQTFAEVVGQEPVVRTLTNALRLGRIAQAYLFVGPRGTGKTSTARILAKALEATNGPTADFNPQEDICAEIAEGRCLDVLEIDGASNNSVEQVRDLRDNVRYSPAKGRYKIYIIDEVHMLSTAAFNALLKTLEEPPAHVKFIFATTEVHKLPATILSRCQRFDLRRIPEVQIRDHLAHICQLEGVVAEPAALEALARYAEGGLRDAESALDQAVSFYGDSVSEADVLSLFGLTGFGPVANLGRALVSGDAGHVLQLAREMISAGKDLGKLSQDLLGFFRNLVIYQVSPAVLQTELSGPEKTVMEEVANQLSRRAALEILEELSHLESRLRYALAKDVIFEVALIQMSQLREKVSLERVLEALGGATALPSLPPTSSSTLAPTSSPSLSLSGTASLAPTETKPEGKTEIKPAAMREEKLSPAPSAIPTNGQGTNAGITRTEAEAAWAQTVARFKEARPLEIETIDAVELFAVKTDTIEVTLPAAMEKKLFYLRSPRNLEILENALTEILQRPFRLVFLLGEGRNAKSAPATPAAPATPSNAIPGKPVPPPPNMAQEDFVNDPVIQNALKIFEAKIVTTKG